MKLLGPLHLTILLVIAVLALSLVMLCRHGLLSARATSLALGSALAINEIVWWITRYSREGVHAGNLPFQLCDVTVWTAALACITRVPALAEFTWFAGMAGAGMALLTPDQPRGRSGLQSISSSPTVASWFQPLFWPLEE